MFLVVAAPLIFLIVTFFPGFGHAVYEHCRSRCGFALHLLTFFSLFVYISSWQTKASCLSVTFNEATATAGSHSVMTVHFAFKSHTFFLLPAVL